MVMLFNLAQRRYISRDVRTQRRYSTVRRVRRVRLSYFKL
jgi:hypothetical protein